MGKTKMVGGLPHPLAMADDYIPLPDKDITEEQKATPPRALPSLVSSFSISRKLGFHEKYISRVSSENTDKYKYIASLDDDRHTALTLFEEIKEDTSVKIIKMCEELNPISHKEFTVIVLKRKMFISTSQFGYFIERILDTKTKNFVQLRTLTKALALLELYEEFSSK